jgi:hypothetical protein
MPWAGIIDDGEGGWAVEGEPLLATKLSESRGYALTAREEIPMDETVAVVELKDLREIQGGGTIDIRDVVPFSEELLCACYGARTALCLNDQHLQASASMCLWTGKACPSCSWRTRGIQTALSWNW